MSDADFALVHYLELARISHEKQQVAGCNRFLVLAGAAACHAGWLDVAETCREQVLRDNSHHLLRRWPTFPDALRSEEFSPFLKQLERFCSPERAEALLSELNLSPVIEEDVSIPEWARTQLRDAFEK